MFSFGEFGVESACLTINFTDTCHAANRRITNSFECDALHQVVFLSLKPVRLIISLKINIYSPSLTPKIKKTP
jgi:hypothetical protein